MNVLIATVTAGAGHVQAAAALEDAWRSRRPRDTIERLDVLEFTPKIFRKAYAEGYLKLVAHAPELWTRFFNKTDNPVRMRQHTRLRRRFATLAGRRFIAHLKRFKPVVALCTHFLPLEILGGFKADARNSCAPFTTCVVTDFEAHSCWMELAVDLYCVAAAATGARLVARGVPAEKVAVTGIPIAAKFSNLVDPSAARKRLGLRDDLPTLLVLGGGFGLGPVAGILSQLDQVKTPLQTVVVCGRNEALRHELAVADTRHPTRTLGFADNMQELMTVADIVITKPGGLTSSEALALGRPLLIVDPIPGQEMANSDFLLEHGAAVKINRLDDLPFKLGQLLGRKKLQDLARAASALGKPAAATAVCEEVLRRAGARGSS